MKAGRGDAHQVRKEKIQEARQRLAALDRELADLRRQSRKVARSADTRIGCLAMREELARLADERASRPTPNWSS